MIPLTCPACTTVSSHDRVVPGAVPPCTCGETPVLPRPAIFRCPGCGLRSKPAVLPLGLARPCPKCRTPLEVERLVETQRHERQAKPGSDLPTVMQEAPPAEPLFTEWTPEGAKPADQPSVVTAGGSTPGANVLAPGTRFGRYEIVRELARGGMGIVSVARDGVLKREVALKVLIAGDLATPEAIQRFVREARAAGQLRHPNIVAVHDAGEVDGRHYFTMDLVQGRELGACFTAGADRAQVLAWLRTTALALHHAHEKGIVHRDLKPQNILIDERNEPVVMDFGLAKDYSSQTFQSLSGAIFGTPAYMSPEQARGDTRSIDRRSDIYSLGVILYEGVTGRRPFGGDTLFDTVRAVINDEPLAPHRLRPDIDADLDTVVLRCLEKDPANRYPTAKAFADDLLALAEGRPIAARPVAAPIRLWRRLRRRPLHLIGGIAAVIILALGLALILGDSQVGRLRTDLASGDPDRRQAAITLLAAGIADGTIAAAEGIPVLRQALVGADTSVAAVAATALAAAGDRESLPALRDRACATDAPAALRSAAASAAADLAAGQDPALAETLLAHLDGSDEDLDAVLVDAAVRAEPNAATTILAATLTTTQRSPRWRARQVLALGGARPSLHPPSMRLLLQLAGDPEPRVGDAAARALELVRTREVILPLYGLERTGADLSAGMGRMAQAIADRERLMNDLASEGSDQDPATVIARRLDSGDVDERIAAAYDLGRIATPASVDPLLRALNDPVSAVRRTAARALAAVAATQTVPDAPLLAALRTDDAAVRSDTALAVGLLAHHAAIPALAENLAMASDAAEVRALVDALGRMQDPAVVPALLTAWNTAVAVDDSALAQDVITALARGRAQQGAAIGALIDALGHSDASVRRSATTALETATGERFGAKAERWREWAAQR